MRGEGVDGFQADAVEADALLESLGIVLTTRVQHRHGFHQLAQGNTTTVVAHGDAQVLVDGHLDALAGVHLELIDGVVDDFLQQHIDAVLGVGAVAQLTDIHTGSCAHVLHIGEVADIVFGVRDPTPLPLPREGSRII